MTDQSTLKSLRGYFVGTAFTLRGDDIDTDQIIPGRFLKGISFAGLGEHAFADARQAARERVNLHPFDNPDRQDASILLDIETSVADPHENTPLRPCTGEVSL